MQAPNRTQATVPPATANTKPTRRIRRGNLNGPRALQVSRYALRLDRDVSTFLSMLAISSVRKLGRATLHRKLKKLVSSRFGPRFDVEDVSMWRYAHDLQDAPMEFAIVDTESPLVYSPRGSGDGPTPYSPSDIASLLLSEGFSGVFVSSPDATHPKYPENAGSLLPEYSIPWPAFEVPATKELIFPTRLEARTPYAFSIWSPGPTILPLVDLLRSYTELGTEIPRTISFLYLWTRSFGLHGFTPVCLALMVIHFFQVQAQLPILQQVIIANGIKLDPSLFKDPTYAWVLQRYSGQGQVTTMKTSLVKIDISTQKRLWGPNRKRGTLLDFFVYWSTSLSRLHASAVSIREGQRFGRTSGHFGLPEPTDLIKNDRPVLDGVTVFQPASWRLQPLIVRDPFVFTYNHTACIPLAAFDEFGRRIKETAGLLNKLMPITRILGPRFALPRKSNSVLTGIDSANIGADAHQSYTSSRVLPSVLENRAKTIGRIQAVITRHHGRQYQIGSFGSTCYGVDSAKSDLDLVILDPEKPNGFVAGYQENQPYIYQVMLLAKQLRNAGFKGVLGIPSAKVPIVKFTDPITGLCCDINVNDRLGMINTALIKQYCDMLPVLRPLLHTIKRWAKPLGLNSPSSNEGSTFSSYALTLMTIGWSQAQGLLPNLQESLDESQVDPRKDVFWVRSGKEDVLECDIRFWKPVDWKPRHKDLGEALVEWFRFWGEKHRYEEDMMSVKHGGLSPRPKVRAAAGPSTAADIDEESHEVEGIAVSDQEELEPGEESEDLEVDEAPNEVDEEDESNEPDLPPHPGSNQPPYEKSLFVLDPFIPAKNVVSAIKVADIQRFQAECVHALTLLRHGFTLRELLHPEVELSRPATRFSAEARGRRGKGKSRAPMPMPQPGAAKPKQRKSQSNPTQPKAGTSQNTQRPGKPK